MASVGGVLYVLAGHSPLVTQVVCSRAFPQRGLHESLGRDALTMWAVWEACLALGLVGCQALPWARAAGCCLGGSGHEVTGCGILRGPGASTGSLVDGVRIPKTLGPLHMHWQVGPDPGDSARLLEGKVGFRSPAAEPRIPRVHFRSYGGGRGSLTQLSVGSVPDTVESGVWVFQRLCSPVSGPGSSWSQARV